MGKYLDFYKKCMEDGRMFAGGVCGCFYYDEYLDLLKPNRPHPIYGYDWYWGFDGKSYRWSELSYSKKEEIMRAFTPLRQNIVLLMAAMSGEDFNELKK